jgi:NADH-quinone oxidoreductase subunit J
MAVSALWTVMCRSLLKAAIGLALTSAIITMLMFRLNSPLAAVFELSVCAGLITAVFVSTISLTKPLTHKEIMEISRERFKRFVYLPVILGLLGLALTRLKLPLDFAFPPAAPENDVRVIMWNMREIDLFGQIAVILGGAFGIVMLFREAKRR